jgi:protein SCO1
MMNRFLLLLPMLLLAACNGGPAEAPPLAGAKIGGPFTLMGEDGKPVSDTQFARKYRIVYFGYTFCPDVCPVDLRNLMLGLKALEKTDAAKAAKIQPLFFTVDPARDTPAILTEYTNAFHERLIGLTGSDAQLEAAKKAFAVFATKGEDKGNGAYLVDHSRVAYLFGPKGEPIAILSHDGTPQQIADELEKWVQ